jgi:hypothetical protein
VDNLAQAGELLFSWRVDGGPWSDFSAAIKLTLYGLFEGAHVIDMRAEDPAGNISTAIASAPFVVDRTPPDTRIDSVTSDPATGSVKVSFSGTDNLPPPNRLSFSWRLDGGAWSAFSTSTQAVFPTLSAGLHTFEVRARDSAGNIDPTPAVQGF